MTAHTLTIDDATLDKFVNYMKYKYTWNRDPIGFKIENTSSDPKVTRIDRTGEAFNPTADFFYNHELYYMPKVLLSAAGVKTEGEDLIGSNLDFTGAAGDAMVWCNNAKVKYWYESDSDTQFYLYAPFDINHPGFDYHPSCRAGGGTLRDHFYTGAYEASMGVNSSGNKILRSITGAQPWTGGEIRSLAFTSGGPTAFTKGELLTGAVSGATGYVVSFYVSSGTWAGGDAAGIVYLSLPGVATATATAFQSGSLNGSVSGVDCATASGAATVLPLTIDNALTYAANKGAGWTISNVYGVSLLRGLFYTQYGTRNSQTAIGPGVVNLASGAGFAGKNTGADSIDTLGTSFGTGSGSGTNGSTPIKWNNIENLWGNCWKFLAGLNVMADGSCRITKQDGTGTIAGTLPAGSYETLPGTLPLTDNYISKIQTDELGALTFSPLQVSGTSTTGLCDFYNHSILNPALVFSGGPWYGGLVAAGIGDWYANGAPSGSGRDIGARLVYIPQA